jgi:DNA modification methylase
MWALGDHRLLCGDSTAKEDVQRAVDGKAALVFTDPPYGVDYQSGAHDKIKNDALKDDALWKFLKTALALAVKHSGPDAAFYIWHASSTREEFAQAMKAVGLVERQYLIWVKPSITLGHADYHWAHEPVFYAHKAGASPTFYGDRAQSTVWHATLQTGGGDERSAIALGNGLILTDGQSEVYLQPTAPKAKKVRRQMVERGVPMAVVPDPGGTDVWMVKRDFQAIHPTQKPVELARRAIENSSKAGDIVLDPFLGSGSTLIACEVTGRRCRGLEYSEKYVDGIVRRWQAFTGRTATNMTRPDVVVS